MKSVKNDLFKTLSKAALAVSGGADSMFMCMSLIPEMKACGVEVEILIVDHGLRVNSYQEAMWVKQYLQSKFNDVKIEVLNANISKTPKSNIQEVARNKRYITLLSYCKKKAIQDLFVAQNLDDQAETIFMRIERGSGLDGACGIKKLIVWDDIRIHRPILNISRSYIEASLSDAGWKWVNDPSNTDEKYSRVRVRNFLHTHPEYDTLIKRFGLLAENLQRTYHFIEQNVLYETSKCVHFDKLGFVEINLSYFKKLHEEIRLRIITNAINHITCSYLKHRLGSILSILERIKDCNNAISQNHKDVSCETPCEPHNKFKGATLGGCEIIKKGDILYIFKELKPNTRKKGVQFNIANEEGIFDGRFKILNKCKESKYIVNHLGFEGYKWLHHKITLPKIINNKIYQGLPAVYSCKKVEPIAVYGLYGDWKLYIEPLFSNS